MSLLEDAINKGANLPGVRGRYAPSPTGPLHLGNVRTALLAWLQVRLAGGTLIMRMEDLDGPRVVEGSAEQILQDLRWLGLDWEEGPDVGGPVGPYTQSERQDFYEEALERLRDKGLIFPCFCSRKDIRQAASAPHANDGSPLYPGTCRGLDEQGIEQMRKKKRRRPAYRYNVQQEERVTFHDGICGEVTEDLIEDVGDFVVKRRDGLFAYQLAVVVDDIAMGVTDVVRGEDLLTSTARQIAIYRALGAKVPRFWHVPLMLGEDGERLSKRDGSRSIAELRDEHGASAGEIVTKLSKSLGIDCGEEVSAQELLAALRGKDLAMLLGTCKIPSL